jgi:hypothetical protein
MMKRLAKIFSLLLGIGCAAVLLPRAALAQAQAPACDDDEAMVESYRQDLSGLTDTVRKESLADFEKDYHQRTCLTKLTLSLGVVNELESCLDKAAEDPAATKDQAAAYKAKHDAYAKLKDKLGTGQKELKAAEAPKAAKALIEKFDFSK